MLTPGEYAEYLTKIQEVCGFDTTMQDEVDEAKNWSVKVMVKPTLLTIAFTNFI